MNGVKEEEWIGLQVKIITQDIQIRNARRDADGYYQAVISALCEIELPDGRRVTVNDARSFRGRCINARRGRPKG